MARGAPVLSFSSNRVNERLRQRGYEDAKAGRERQRTEEAYLIGYRGGLKSIAYREKQ